MEEKWKDIPGYEGFYRASSCGRVKSLRSGKILKPGPHGRGYLQVNLSVKNKVVHKNVHALVLLAFRGPRPFLGSRVEIRHLNGKKADNRLCNLKYGTIEQNMADRVLHGKGQYGFRNPMRRLKRKFGMVA